jgi:hypothetical protein
MNHPREMVYLGERRQKLVAASWHKCPKLPDNFDQILKVMFFKVPGLLT